MDICNSFANQGFKNIIILSGHGGSENLRAVNEAPIIFYRRYHWWRGKINIAPVFICDLSKEWQKAFKIRDYHAALIETSLILYLRPELVRSKIVRDKAPIANMLRKNPDSYQVFKKLVNDRFVAVQTSQDPRIKVGVMGDVSKIDVEIGKKIVDECVVSLGNLVRKLG
jgi:creatinine amidohydrolase/Fe(II)-dependent formamide hydrolase-like protein